VLQKLNDQRIRSAIAGGLGGLLSWAFIEPLVAPRLQGVTRVADMYPLDALFGALAGVCIGAALGIAEGILMRSTYRATRGAVIGAVAGIIGGAIGLVIGEMVYQPLKLLCFVGRTLGWAVFGAFLGVAEGVTRRSWQGVRSAALGGMIGGAIGGFAFDLVGVFAMLLFRSDALSRGIALTILGASIGLWIVVMERRLSPATLKITSGQFEGREFYLDKPKITMGRDERGDIAIFGDPEIRGHHAMLTHGGTGYLIEAVSGAAVLVNKQSISRQSLVNEDEVLVGRTRLIYLDKSGATTRAVSEPVAPEPVQLPSLLAPSPAVLPATPDAAWPPGAGALWLVDARTGQRYALQSGVTTIGRAPDNNIVLDGATVSGYHAEVRYENGQYVLHDKDSRNGTFVNGRRISAPNLIKPGWRLTIGDIELTVGS
jgi:pSer/pThr/pTyr-binding forkhead associated (FHA) protein